MSTRLIELESRFIAVALVGFAGVAFSVTGALGWLFGDGDAQLLLLPGVALLLCVALLVVRTKRAIQVELVRDRLRGAVPVTRYRTTVQREDGSQFVFSATFQLHAGEYVEAQADGTLCSANLLGSNRVVGVVVACKPEAPENRTLRW